MLGRSLLMSESHIGSAEAGYRDPFTAGGIWFGAKEQGLAFHLHEVGCGRFGREWSFPAVRSPFWRLYWNAAPGAWVESGGERAGLAPARFVVVPSHTVFDTRGAAAPVLHFWIHFSLYPDLALQENRPVVIPCRNRRAMAALARRARRREPEDRRALYHLCSALLHETFAHFPGAAASLPARLRVLLDHLESSLGRPLSVAEMARRAGMSRGGFIRWFRECLEISPGRYLQRRRIDHACRLLKYSAASIEEIAEAVGFANRNHFTRVFQSRMGAGPAAFRKG